MPCRGWRQRRVEGFGGLTDRIREAMRASERLVRLLERLSREGLRRGGAASPLTSDEVVAATSAVRATIGALAMTTPSMLSTHFNEYTGRIGELLVLAERVAEHGIAFPEGEADEWQSFR